MFDVKVVLRLFVVTAVINTLFNEVFAYKTTTFTYLDRVFIYINIFSTSTPTRETSAP